ncbi:MAG: OmpW family outer membrane protein, partial [Acidimicrobiia bacterium]
MRPYVGAGLNYTAFFDEETPGGAERFAADPERIVWARRLAGGAPRTIRFLRVELQALNLSMPFA